MKTPVLALTTVALAGGAVPALAAVPTGNVLQNPGFEVAPTLDAGGNPSLPASWSLVGAVDPSIEPNDLCYGADGGFPDSTNSKAISGGSRFYFAGYTAQISIYQDYVLQNPGEFVGKTLRIGGQFGGYSSQGDNAQLGVDFLKADSTILGTTVTDPVSAADRGNATTFVARSKTTGPIPSGTAKLHFFVAATRTDGSANDGYADNVFATFDATDPAPVASSNDPKCPVVPETPPADNPPATPPDVKTPPVVVTPPIVAKKTPKLAVKDVVTGLPSTRSCVSRRAFRIRLRNPSGTTITTASVKVNGKTVATRKGKRVTAPVNLKGLPRGSYKVSIKVVLTDGRTVSTTRKYRTCAKKRRK